MRLIPWSVLLLAVLAVVAIPERSQPAPAPKDTGAPTGPITPAQLKDSSNNLKQITLGIVNYSDTMGIMPTNIQSSDNKPILSWRVQILPYIEQNNLYKEFKLDEPWDGDHNKKLIAKMPKLYAPVRGGKKDGGLTYYQAFAGSNGWLKPGARFPASFPDGTSNTFLLAEGAKPVTWTKPDDLVYDGKKVPALGGQFGGQFHAAMADGSVKRFKKGVDPAILKLLIDPADGMPLPEDIGGVDTDEKK